MVCIEILPPNGRADMRVSDLLLPGTKSWNYDLVRGLMESQVVAEAIISMPLREST